MLAPAARLCKKSHRVCHLKGSGACLLQWGWSMCSVQQHMAGDRWQVCGVTHSQEVAAGTAGVTMTGMAAALGGLKKSNNGMDDR